jgi:hypothetical protein
MVIARAGQARRLAPVGETPGQRVPGGRRADSLPPRPSAARPGRVSAAELFGQLFPSGVQMTGELLADLEQRARLTGKLAAHGWMPSPADWLTCGLADN